MIPKTTWGVAAAGAGLCFLGYCIYFDQKRRSDPLFKQKLREKRKKAKKQQDKKSTTQFPDLNNPDAMQKFFLQEVQLGEEHLATGDVDKGVEHLTNAVAVCGQPQQLLQVLQQTLPPQVFQLLIEQLPMVSQRMAMRSSLGSTPQSSGPTIATLEEDDVE